MGRNTVLEAYEQLLAEGYIQAEAGAGTWVAFNRPSPRMLPSLPRQFGPEFRVEANSWPEIRNRREVQTRSTYNRVSRNLSLFPSETWSRLLSRNARQRGSDMIGYYDYAGHRALREAIAAYVGVARGVDCEPEQVIVVTGAQGALDLISRIVMDDGDRCGWKIRVTLGRVARCRQAALNSCP